MKPYHPDTEARQGALIRPGGGYLVPASPAPLQRPSKLAAGMAATIRRTRLLPQDRMAPLSTDALILSVRGTLDSLATSYRYELQKRSCPCCGSKAGGLMLKPGGNGARRLAKLRKRHRQRN